VVEGSVRKDGDKLRLVAQLIDAKTGEHVWAERFDRSGTDPWALQDAITGMIVSAMTGEYGALKQAQYRQAWGKEATTLEESSGLAGEIAAASSVCLWHTDMTSALGQKQTWQDASATSALQT
jgi:hypothetical protein